MHAYRIETTIETDGTLMLGALPFQAGERVEVIVLPAAEQAPGRDHRRLRGTVVRYDHPTAPVADEDWESTR